jgi:hypothetical protein
MHFDLAFKIGQGDNILVTEKVPVNKISTPARTVQALFATPSSLRYLVA